MHVSVNRVRLFFDVEARSSCPMAPGMRQKPTLLLLHGGPGFDHSIYKPAYSALADIAQIVYLDHRGNGRARMMVRGKLASGAVGRRRARVRDALGITDPIVLGASFGGMVALAYATRHPNHPSKLVLISTEAAGDTYLDRRVALFERFGGPEVGALARRRFLDADSPRDQAAVDAWRKLAFPVYTRTPRDPNLGSRTVGRPEVALHFSAKPGGEPHLQHVPRSPSHPVPYPCHGRRRRSMHPIETRQISRRRYPPILWFERLQLRACRSDAPERAMALLGTSSSCDARLAMTRRLGANRHPLV
jgi:proline iminopeptidase